jgi:uncharacterized phage protein (TIGR01671 family)
MKREIKFRAWDAEKQQMLRGSQFDVEAQNGKVFKITPDLQCEYKEWLLMQFTGLLDKNGKEIYEGDIVRILYTDWLSKPDTDSRTIEQYLKDIAKVREIIWYEGRWLTAIKKDGEYYYGSIGVAPHGYIEVIGNIHENPELLPHQHT